MKKRRRFTSEFKSKVALEALRQQPPLHEIAKRYEVHPTQVSGWKKALLGNAGEHISRVSLFSLVFEFQARLTINFPDDPATHAGQRGASARP